MCLKRNPAGDTTASVWIFISVTWSKLNQSTNGRQAQRVHQQWQAKQALNSDITTTWGHFTSQYHTLSCTGQFHATYHCLGYAVRTVGKTCRVPAKLRDSIRIRIGCPDSNSIRKWRADSKILNRPHMLCAVIPQTTLTHSSTKTSTFAPFVVEIYVYNSTLQDFTCSCTAVARAHTQLPHDNRNWTCKRLPPDSVWE